MSELPTGTVTLLLADVEGSTRLWESRPDDMTDAVALLDRTVSELVTAHGGARPVEQGEGDSFVAAFTRASDAVACALDIQRAPLAPIALRIGVHTGEVQLRDEGNYIGPTVNRAARLRDLAHGGQTVLSGATEAVVTDQLPNGASLTGLGTHPLRDLPRPERVLQLCHPDLRADFPPLRTLSERGAPHLPVQLTSFVGRSVEMSDVREILAHNRLMTLTGAGGVGKTRLALRVAAEVAGDFDGGVWCVDLAPLTDPGGVPGAMARALGLPDQPGRSTTDTLTRFIADARTLVVLDNCEHLLDACAALVVALLGACPELTVLATSREPIGVAGEVSWRVPSLSLDDEAVALFTDRARRVRPEFRVADDNAATVREICRRLDGLPLAIELAAARVRALSPDEIAEGLHDRFRLLTGGARTAVRRQQTLRASVDWSHALLPEPERVLFGRLAVFLGGFDLDAALFVCGDDAEHYEVLDRLTMLVDKSLVVADDRRRGTRFRLLETVRQYALEKLRESGEADAVRARHRDHYTATAALLDAPGSADHERRVEQAETEIDNLRAAFAWSRENSETERALALASSLQPLWLSRGRIQEGRAWFGSVLTGDDPCDIAVPAAARARALADKAALDIWVDVAAGMDQARSALAIARDLGDPALLARALAACSYVASYGYDAERAQRYFTEAIDLARSLDDRWRLSQVLTRKAVSAMFVGDPISARAAAEEGRDLAEAIGDHPASQECRLCLGWARLIQGDVSGAVAQTREVVADVEAAHDIFLLPGSCQGLSAALAHQGEIGAAGAAADAALSAATENGGFFLALGHSAVALAALAAGDVAAAREASECAWRFMSFEPSFAAAQRAFNGTEVALATGDLATARRWADDAVSVATGWHLVIALTVRARIAIAADEREQADRDAHTALACAADLRAHLTVPGILECLAELAAAAADADADGRRREAARLFGAAEAVRQRTGVVRFKVHQAGYESSVAKLRNAMGDHECDSAWAEGAALSTDEAIAYAQRGHGPRKRPASGWASLTPTERDIVRLVSTGLGNKEIAGRLFVSPRTVQSHLTHVFAKLGLSSRVQLAQEAARHA
ncbi:helix-turn-helix transcriptional regulator [Rhodococcus tukisamuensis]|uniref:Predicted ATPase n=1 Tax=Rhodococcus tukisamuensis TaxID=168276 RepID=A0A1G6R0V2_9NOCA|nr:LuxR family transcriptional regulator [Rhodococcus tukisamuensis]SDC98063.1 Predicted ATPase [Rhodococcus tukisamuensis]